MSTSSTLDASRIIGARETQEAVQETSQEIIVSGVKPTGLLHLGNFFGAVEQHLRLQSPDAYFFIVNYHALTTVQERDALRRHSLNIALDYLALGLEAKEGDEAALFLQSDVPEVTELAWIFGTLLTVPTLERGVSYKDALARSSTPNAGLLNYPVLQAADILMYSSPERGLLVPVGRDQRQHVEVSRELARAFNRAFCEAAPLFPEPRALVLDEVAVVPGLDGRKMSKSYGNTINVFDEGEVLERKVMSIPTDSAPLAAPKNPERDRVFALIKLVATDEEREEIAAAYRAGGYGYADAKRELVRIIHRTFEEARARRRELVARPDDVMDVLREGAKEAREKAQSTMERVREHVGLLRTVR